MARLTAAFGSSHSIMLACELEDWLHKFTEADQVLPFYDKEGRTLSFAQVLALAPPEAPAVVTPEAITARYRAMETALAEMKRRLRAAQLDALVILGDDQHELFHDENMPSIGLYYGDSIRNEARTELPPSEWYRRAQMLRLEPKEEKHYPCHAKLARHLIAGLRDREFDIAAVAGLAPGQHEGHAYAFVHRWYLEDVDLPIVPVFLNTYYDPNQPLPRRCVRLGSALRQAIEDYPEPLRIGIMASGGLSHFRVEEDIDRGLFEAFARKDLDALERMDPRRLKAGSSEIRSWIAVGAAALGLELKWTAYVPGYRTLALTGTGLGFAEWG